MCFEISVCNTKVPFYLQQREGVMGRGLGRGRGGGGPVRGRGEFGGGPGRGLGRGDGFRGSQEETQFAVPADKCGLVIGKGLSLKYCIYIQVWLGHRKRFVIEILYLFVNLL